MNERRAVSSIALSGLFIQNLLENDDDLYLFSVMSGGSEQSGISS
jgi:hypothetical protein